MEDLLKNHKFVAIYAFIKVEHLGYEWKHYDVTDNCRDADILGYVESGYNWVPHHVQQLEGKGSVKKWCERAREKFEDLIEIYYDCDESEEDKAKSKFYTGI